MSKDWLIRTKTNQILGPVSHQKMCDLVRKKMLSEEDEIAAGNGYWFWIKEKDLLDKYLFGETPQPFNPIERAEKESSDNSDPLSSDTGDVESAGEANLSRIASTKRKYCSKGRHSRTRNLFASRRNIHRVRRRANVKSFSCSGGFGVS